MTQDNIETLKRELNDTAKQINVIYDKNNISLVCADGALYLFDGDIRYGLGSNPYEPCTYIKRGDKLCTVVHNAYTTDQIYSLAISGGTAENITGSRYGIDMICSILCFAAREFSDCDIGMLESSYVVEKMKQLNAFSPNTAVDIRKFGIKNISSCFFSKKARDRVYITEAGKFYICIKK